MIRILTLIVALYSIVLLFTGCLSPKKVDELIAKEQQTSILLRDSLAYSQQQLRKTDSLLTAARGGNELMLIAQQQLQDRLLRLDDEIEQLTGNLNNTQQNLQQQLRQLTQEKAKLNNQIIQLQQRYQSITDDYENQLASVSQQIATDSILAAAGQLRSRAGSVSFTISSEQLFQSTNSNRLNRSADELLAPLASIMEANPLLELTIIGHSDNQQRGNTGGGSRGFSAARAVSIAERLSKQFYLNAKRIAAVGMGEAAPLQSNATSAGRAANRRVEFRFNNNVANLLRSLNKVRQPDEK